MNCEQWEERIALYVGGDLPAGQAAGVEGHLRECAGCQVFAGGMRSSLECLREAHEDLPSAPHFAAVRARVMAEVERQRRPAWRRVFAWGALAATLLVAIGGFRFYRPVPAPPVVAIARPGAPAVGFEIPAKKLRLPAQRRAEVVRPTETVTIKLVTDDPDVVIYWIAERKGD
jgi:anti-sigma factor RsiW